MTDARHDEVHDPGFGERGVEDDVADILEMGPPPAPPALSVDAEDPEVPSADAWEQALPTDPDAPLPPQPRVSDPEVPAADAWEQALPTDRDDDY